jgi:hypothetical protein
MAEEKSSGSTQVVTGQFNAPCLFGYGIVDAWKQAAFTGTDRVKVDQGHLLFKQRHPHDIGIDAGATRVGEDDWAFAGHFECLSNAVEFDLVPSWREHMPHLSLDFYIESKVDANKNRNQSGRVMAQ